MGFILLKKVDIAVLTLQGGEGGGAMPTSWPMASTRTEAGGMTAALFVRVNMS